MKRSSSIWILLFGGDVDDDSDGVIGNNVDDDDNVNFELNSVEFGLNNKSIAPEKFTNLFV